MRAKNAAEMVKSLRAMDAARQMYDDAFESGRPIPLSSLTVASHAVPRPIWSEGAVVRRVAVAVRAVSRLVALCRVGFQVAEHSGSLLGSAFGSRRTAPASAPRIHIPMVVLDRSDVQMPRVYARRIVAMVAGEHAFGYGPSVQGQRHMRGGHLSARAVADKAIGTLAARSSPHPRPARVWASRVIDAFCEAGLKGPRIHAWILP